MKRVTKPCAECGALITRAPSGMKGNVCCSPACTTAQRIARMAKLNADLNPHRMTMDVREKLRIAHLDSGLGVTYTKTFSRHTHRIVAEQILGRPLAKGEIVHHKDENKRNNDPSNIEIFANQAEHARHHNLKRWKK